MGQYVLQTTTQMLICKHRHRPHTGRITGQGNYEFFVSCEGLVNAAAGTEIYTYT